MEYDDSLKRTLISAEIYLPLVAVRAWKNNNTPEL